MRALKTIRGLSGWRPTFLGTSNTNFILFFYLTLPTTPNIENAFNDAREDYQPFEGICFTDTFELYERGEIPLNLAGVMKENSARVNEQKNSRIEIIVGNPPYSVGQKSANDNNQNQTYSNLEARIGATYAAKTDATNKNSLYDSYIKAFRWASDRIDEGIIGFVTNAGWIDGAAIDGLRKCFADEFAERYVFNLRGNQRTQGEISKRKGGKIFGSGSRATIAITILVKAPHDGDTKIFYHDIGDYLSREQKLDKIKNISSVLSDEFKLITPNERGDWINQRGDEFDNFIPLAPDKKFDGAAQSFFVTRSTGIQTNRDAWCYNFSRAELEKNIQTTIDYYNTHEPTDIDPTKINWASSTIQYKNRECEITFDAAQIIESFYRPFCKTNLYYDEILNHRRFKMPKLFPTACEENLRTSVHKRLSKV